MAFPVSLDVTRAESIRTMLATVVSTVGRVDVLVNNAGVVEIQPIFEIDERAWDRVFNVNVKGLFFTLQAVAERMVKQDEGGKIINLASEAGQRADGMVIAYSATKAAVISITKTAALALIPHRINVDAISPGVVDTPMWVEVDRMSRGGKEPTSGSPGAKRSSRCPSGDSGSPRISRALPCSWPPPTPTPCSARPSTWTAAGS